MAKIKLSMEEDVKESIIRLLKTPARNEVIRWLHFPLNIARDASTRLMPVTVSISFDSYYDKSRLYPSFYWHVSSDVCQRIYNGGFINHSKDEESFDYSIHT